MTSGSGLSISPRSSLQAEGDGFVGDKLTALERDKTLTLDAGWWVQNRRLARELCSRMAQMLAEPLPVRKEMPVASPDLSLRIADTVTLRLDAEKPQRLCGVAYTYDDTGVGQKVTTRQLRP